MNSTKDNNAERQAQCKLCNKIDYKIKRPKSVSGFSLCVNRDGKHWLGSVCPECAPKVRKTRYRKRQDIPEIMCESCGKRYKPKHNNTKRGCSPKCIMRINRGLDRDSLGKDKHLLEISMKK